MSGRPYPEDFRREAVALYEKNPNSTLKSIAAEVGVSECSLSAWCRTYGTGTRARGRRPTETTSEQPGAEETLEAKVARLEARNAERQAKVGQLQDDHERLSTERDILRSAAKYFAGQTRW